MVATILQLAGLLAITGAAFATDPAAGVAALGATAVYVGLALERD